MEIVEYSLNIDFENCIEKIYYELETEKAVMFGRQEDEKILFIPKSCIKGGWKKDKLYPQTVVVNFGIVLYWKPRRSS